ncbi:MAG: ribbon-helix-helix protein, CopG family, partial [Campylobacter sp.]
MKKEEKESAVRFSISLPTKLFEDLDEMVRAKQYLSRSEFIRDLIREKMVEGVLHGDGEDDCVGVLCIAYDHHQSDLIEQL